MENEAEIAVSKPTWAKLQNCVASTLFLGSAEESVLQQAAQLAGPRGIPIVSTESFSTIHGCALCCTQQIL